MCYLDLLRRNRRLRLFLIKYLFVAFFFIVYTSIKNGKKIGHAIHFSHVFSGFLFQVKRLFYARNHNGCFIEFFFFLSCWGCFCVFLQDFRRSKPEISINIKDRGIFNTKHNYKTCNWGGIEKYFSMFC